MGLLKDAIDELSQLNLNSCATESIKTALSKLGSIPAPIRDIHKGSLIYRASNLKINEKINNIKRLSYCPAKKNKTFQRASTPKQTMFYGVIGNLEEKLHQENCEMLAMQESCSLFRDSTVADGIYRVAVSKWRILDTISFLTLMNPDSTNKSKRLNEMVQDLLTYIKANTDKFSEEDAIAFQKFMCNQFIKPVNNDNQYKISALFTLEVIKRIDGVIWQSSVAIDEKLNDTLCVAIKPKTIDACMKCEEYSLYTFVVKNGKISSCNREVFNLIADSPRSKKKKKRIIKSIKRGKGIITKRRIRKRNRRKNEC